MTSGSWRFRPPLERTCLLSSGVRCNVALGEATPQLITDALPSHDASAVGMAPRSLPGRPPACRPAWGLGEGGHTTVTSYRRDGAQSVRDTPSSLHSALHNAAAGRHAARAARRHHADVPAAALPRRRAAGAGPLVMLLMLVMPHEGHMRVAT